MRLLLLQPAGGREAPDRDRLDRDKYLRRGKNYIVTEAVSVDEDGRLIDRVITHELKQPSEVGKKWGG